MKVALVHDDLIQFGGAERVLLALHEIWPEAPVYTSLISPEWKSLAAKQNLVVNTSFMQSLPKAIDWHKYYVPALLYLNAFESFDLSSYDLVISSTSRFSHGVVTKPGTKHIALCHSPNRAAWDFKTYTESESVGVFKKLAFKLAMLPLSYIRLWDYVAYKRVDRVIANSINVRDKIKRFYLRDAEIINPFADVSSFTSSIVESYKDSEPYYLVISRLVSWKKIELAIEACGRVGKKLIIVGDGPDLKRLQSFSSNKTAFLGRVSEEEKISLLKGCQAVIFPQNEDFGIVPVEAMACGKPVLALAYGGALESVVAGVTGEFFADQTIDSLEAALKVFDPAKYSSEACVSRALQFDKSVFIAKIRSYVDSLYVPSN